MHRIDGSGHLNGTFVAEDPFNNQPGTLITPDWLNAVQDEIANVINAGSISLDKNNNSQLEQAILNLIAQAINNTGTPVTPDVILPGTIMYWPTSFAPSGWLKANGAAISRASYADLFSLINTFYGAGDGFSTFNLPDLRGEFIRGFDDGRGVDVGRVFGSNQAATEIATTVFQAAFTYYSNADSLRAGNTISGAGVAGYWRPENYIRMRPRNIALLPCIKY